MSRYIRTKDGEVFDIHEYWSSKAFEIEPNEDYWVDEMLRKKGIDKKDCKVVSTIEELVDEFVCEHSVIESSPRKEGGQIVGRYYKIDNAKMLAEKGLNVYGAVWTDKGLIYVAKMDDKGKLELL